MVEKNRTTPSIYIDAWEVCVVRTAPFRIFACTVSFDPLQHLRRSQHPWRRAAGAPLAFSRWGAFDSEGRRASEKAEVLEKGSGVNLIEVSAHGITYLIRIVSDVQGRYHVALLLRWSNNVDRQGPSFEALAVVGSQELTFPRQLITLREVLT